MSKYIIEGNINFQEELYKLLDEPSDDENELCQITSLHLKDNFVTLECKHHFNYDALYKEIYKQKYEFKTYDINSLTKNNLQKFRDSNLDYFIKCPYCRNIQFTILPYYKELGLKEIYGINSLDKNIPNSITINNPSNSFNIFGTTFKAGECCEKSNSFGDKCIYKYVATIPNTQLTYCKYHYRTGLRNYKMAEKKKIIDARLIVKKEKEDKLKEKKKLLEEMNIERESKGLPPLKRLPALKKKVENVVNVENVVKIENIVEQQGQPIQQYVPEEDNGCKAILKSGPNKGKSCGGNAFILTGLCKRHSPKDQQNDKISTNVL